MRRYKLFGELLIEDSGELSALNNSHKGIALVTYLILQKRPVGREIAADLLWDSMTQQQASNRFRALLKRVRRLTPELQATRQYLTFELSDDAFVDIYELERVLESDDIEQIDRGLELYVGELLTGYYLEEAPRFNEWLAVERENWRRQVISAYTRVCLAYAAEKRWEKGAVAAQRWLEIDELDETALKFCLEFLAANGDFELALQQYRYTRQRLWDELGVTPNEDIEQVVAQIESLKQEKTSVVSWDTLVADKVEWPDPEQLATPGELPASAYVPLQRNSDFIGREKTLLSLANQLLPRRDEQIDMNRRRVMAVTGMGGLGKTQTAVEFCYRYGRFFSGGVYWLNFSDPDGVPKEVALVGSDRGMGLYRRSDRLKQVDKVDLVMKAWQEPVHRLLIFDNCEADELLSKWLPVTGGCSVLVTSRRAKWPRELNVNHHALPFLAPAESVSLLQSLAPRLTLDEANHIVDELGGLTLAIHLAGCFLERYQRIPADLYLNQLKSLNVLNHPSLQGHGVSHSPTDHDRHVTRTFEINYEELHSSEHEADAYALKILRYAAVFAAGTAIPIDYLYHLSGVEDGGLTTFLMADDGLNRLINLGLIQRHGEFVTLHRLINLFVRELPFDLSAMESAAACLLVDEITKYYTEQHSDHRLPLDTAHVRHLSGVELDKQTEYGIHLAQGLGRHLVAIGDLAEGREYLERALGVAEHVFGVAGAGVGHILITLSTVVWQIETAVAAEPHARRALDIMLVSYGEIDDHTARCFNNLAIILARQGNYEEAISLYQRALNVYRELNQPQNTEPARIYYNIGIVNFRLGDYAAAKRAYDHSIEHYKLVVSHDHPSLLQPLTAGAFLQILYGEYVQAYEKGDQALSVCKAQLGPSHPQTSTLLGVVGIALLHLERRSEAITYLTESVTWREQIFGPNSRQVLSMLTWLGYAHYLDGDFVLGRELLARAIANQENDTPSEQTAEVDTRFAEVLLASGDDELAKTHLDKAWGFWAQSSETLNPLAAVTLNGFARWSLNQGGVTAAREYYQQAIDLLADRVSEQHYDLITARRGLDKLVNLSG